MKTMYFTEAIDDALAQAMKDDTRIILFGEDVPLQEDPPEGEPPEPPED